MKKKYQESGELEILWNARDNLPLGDRITFNGYFIGLLSCKVSKKEWAEAVETALQLLLEGKTKQNKVREGNNESTLGRVT